MAGMELPGPLKTSSNAAGASARAAGAKTEAARINRPMLPNPKPNRAAEIQTRLSESHRPAQH